MYTETLKPLEEFIPVVESFAGNAFDQEEAPKYLSAIQTFLDKIGGKAFVPVVVEVEGGVGHGHLGKMMSDTLFVALPYIGGTLPSLVNQTEKEMYRWLLDLYADEKDVIEKDHFTASPYTKYTNVDIIPDNMILVRLWWD